jgi:hypothetical protein
VAHTLPLAVAAGLSPLLLAPAAQAQTAPWTVVASPDASTGNNQLDAVASISASDVWAVGSAENSQGNDQTLAEHWDGTAWSIVPTPAVVTGGLHGVAAISSTDVWAGGGFLLSSRGNTAQFMNWDGRKWTIAKSPATTGGISAMAAVSSTDVWAVGSIPSGSVAQTFIEHFNGKKWAIVPSPNDGTGNNLLTGVTAISASDVWAVGHFTTSTSSGTLFQTLTEHWDSTAWSIIPSLSPAGTGSGSELNAAAAVSTSDVWAVGDSNNGTLAEQWNGTSWTVVPTPSLSGALQSLLFGAAVVSPGDIWAVGESFNSSGIPATLIEQWNGTTWATVASPSPGGSATLSAASADPVSGQAWAVGNFTVGPGSAGGEQTLTEFNS